MREHDPLLTSASVKLWLQALDVPHADSVVERRLAQKRAANRAVRERLLAELPDLDLGAMRRGHYGKPYLPAPHAHVGFNPSDSGGWCLIGMAAGTELGVDLEVVQSRPKAMAIARRHFPAAEVDWLATQSDPERAFLRLWTLKEALFKAIGRGLGYGLGQARFEPGDEGHLRLADLSGPASPANRWSVHSLDLGADHVAAVVYEGPPRTLHWPSTPDGTLIAGN